MKLLGSIENKITKDKNGENVPHLEITEVVLYFILTLLIMIINKIQEYYTLLFQINLLVASWKFLQHSTQNMIKLKYGLQIKTVNH